MTVILAASVLILLSLPLGLAAKSLAFAVLTAYGSHIFWRYGLLRHKHAVTGIRCLGDGSWHLETRAGMRAAELSGDSTVTGLISILRFRTGTGLLKHSCIVLRDSFVQPDCYRQMLVILRMKRQES
jgi:hypothetical protein